jgi:hypothetical protein
LVTREKSRAAPNAPNNGTAAIPKMTATLPFLDARKLRHRRANFNNGSGKESRIIDEPQDMMIMFSALKCEVYTNLYVR